MALTPNTTYGNLQGGMPTPSGIPGFNAAYGLTAHSGGGATSALPLPSWLNVITTVGSTADSVALPPGYAGAQVVVINAAVANSLTVYGNGLDTIAAHTVTTQVTTGVAIAAGAMNVFFCQVGEGGTTNNVTAAQWKALN